MLLSTADEAVVAAADALAEELAAVQADSTAVEFESILVQCTDAISEETGIDYGDACDAGGCC